MMTASEATKKLIEKASEDETFRSNLIANPKSVIEQEFGVQLPENFSVTVHEQTSTEAHVVLPPDPKLSDEQLGAAAGGDIFFGACWS